MSYYLNIYVAEHADIANQFIPPNENTLQSFGLKDTEEKVMMTKLLTKQYHRDSETQESEDAPDLIEMLEKLVSINATKSATIEFYLDEELPQLLEFSFDDWDVEDDFELPLSSSGTPAVVYRNKKSLGDFLERFKAMRKQNFFARLLNRLKGNMKTVSFNQDYISQAELHNLINIVNFAKESESGLFVFCWQ